MEGLLGLLVLVVLAVPVLLVIALVSIGKLKQRVGELEAGLGRLQSDGAGWTPQAAGGAEVPSDTAAPAPRAPAPEAPGEHEPTLSELLAARATQVPAAPAAPTPGDEAPPPLPLPPQPSIAARETAAADGVEAATAAAAAAPPRPARVQSATASTPSSIDAATRVVRRWFTTGNVPVKVGMLVLLAGVAALLKYANEQGWLQLPIELRLAGVAAAAVAGLVFGWRQRTAKPAFALALQAGAALGLSVVLVAGLGVLAVLQDSRTLAVLGILAGFLAPIWLSTGGGSHVALFSYYAVLNAAILAIAWAKSWRVLNLLGFVFT